MRSILLSSIVLFGFVGSALAFGEPPIRNAQDAACRDVARSRVFSTPNPQGLSIFALGSQIYHQCMRTAGASGSKGRVRQSQAQ